MKNTKLKDNKGFAASDALIAVLIIALFTGIIATLIYNIYLSNTSLKRMSKANGYIVDVFEYIDKTYYGEVNQEDLIKYFNDKYNTEAQAVSNNEQSVNTPYKVIINVEKYNELEGNSDKLDLVKQITMQVNYKLGSRDQKIKMKKIKSRETLSTPNKPDLSLVNLEENQKAYPIKLINNQYQVCNENDKNWYNYETNKPAEIIVTSQELKIGDIIDKTDENIIEYQWTPRYAENLDGDIKYLYSNTNKYVGLQDGYEKLLDLEADYIVGSNFGNTTGIWELINKTL